jgi:hypothetical protein
MVDVTFVGNQYRLWIYRRPTNRVSSVSTLSDYGLDGRGSIPRHRQRIFPLTSEPRPALGPTQPPVQWVPGALCPGVKGGRGVMLTAQPLLVPRLRKSRSYTFCHSNAPLQSVTANMFWALGIITCSDIQWYRMIGPLTNFRPGKTDRR